MYDSIYFFCLVLSISILVVRDLKIVFDFVKFKEILKLFLCLILFNIAACGTLIYFNQINLVAFFIANAVFCICIDSYCFIKKRGALLKIEESLSLCLDSRKLAPNSFFGEKSFVSKMLLNRFFEENTKRVNFVSSYFELDKKKEEAIFTLQAMISHEITLYGSLMRRLLNFSYFIFISVLTSYYFNYGFAVLCWFICCFNFIVKYRIIFFYLL